MQANLIPEGQHAANHGHSSIGQFFVNVQILADANRQQAVILFSMLFTLIIWVFSALSLMIAAIFYVVFLWHHIPRTDGGLSNYCRRKVDSRLHKIVGVKVNKALARANTVLTEPDTKDGFNGARPPVKRQPTIPILDVQHDDKLQDMPLLQRQGTQASLPPYTSNPPSRNPSDSSSAIREPRIPDIFPDRPIPPERSATQNSNRSDGSYASNAPLIGAASDMGHGNPGSRPPPARIDSARTDCSNRPPVGRSDTYGSQGTQRSYRPPLGRESPASQNNLYGTPRGPPSRQDTDLSNYAPSTRSTPSPFPAQSRKPTPQNLPLDAIGKRTHTPGGHRYVPPSMLVQEFEMRPQPPATSSARLPQTANNGYVAFNPSLHSTTTNPTYPTPAPSPLPVRNFTQPNRPPHADYFGQQSTPQRSGTAPLPQTSPYDDTIYDDYRNDRTSDKPGRSATAGPGPWAAHAPPMPRAATASPAPWNGGRRNPPAYADESVRPTPAGVGTANPYNGQRRQDMPVRAGTADPYNGQRRQVGPIRAGTADPWDGQRRQDAAHGPGFDQF